MFLALIFTAIQTFAASTEPSIPGLTNKTLVLKSSNVEGFCAAKVKPEMRTVEGRPVLVLNDVLHRFVWQQISTADEVQEIEQTQDKSQLKLVTNEDRTILKLSGDVIELTVNSGKKDRNGIFHINTKLQPIRCLWAAK